MAAGYLLVVRDDVLLAQQVDESGTLEEASRYHWRGDHDWRTKSVRGIAAHRAVGGGISASSRAGAGSTAVDCGSVRWASPETSGRCGWRLMIDTRCDRHRSPPSHARHHDRSIGIGSTQSTAHAGACGDSDPVWSPDGRRVLFKSLQTGRPALFVKRAHDKDADDEAFVEEKPRRRIGGTPTS